MRSLYKLGYLKVALNDAKNCKQDGPKGYSFGVRTELS